MNHIKGKDSNFRLQRAIKKYNLKNFNAVIYYFHAASLREIAYQFFLFLIYLT